MSNTNISKSETNKLSFADISLINMQADPDPLLNKAFEELKKISKGTELSEEKTPNLYRVFSTLEFEKGMLLSVCFPKLYQSFAISLNRKFQKEFDCQTPSEKSLAELTVVNFCRTLFVQKKINDYIERGTVTDIGVGYLNFLSKELDRANRHYTTALQTLKVIKQPNIEMNIKTQTTVIGQNQVIQNKNT
jgi:hypothetical protein